MTTPLDRAEAILWLAGGWRIVAPQPWYIVAILEFLADDCDFA